MKINIILGILLIAVSLILGYYGATQISQSNKSVEVLGVEIEASNKTQQQEGFVFLGLGVIVCVGGIYLIKWK